MDAAGNIDPEPASWAWTIDSTPPETAIVAGPAGPTAATTATLRFSSPDDAGAGFECRLGEAEWASCASPVELEGLADGDHAFGVRAGDAAGNVDATEATHSWTVDTAPPDTSLAEVPSDPTRSTTATFALEATEPHSGFECLLDDGAWEDCEPAHVAEGLAEGTHSFAARATDMAGHVDPDPVVQTWTIDRTTAPIATLQTARNPARTRQVVRLDATASRDPLDASIIAYEWDLDGDGTYELDTRTRATAEHVYTEPGPVQVGLRITTDAGGTDEDALALDLDGVEPETLAALRAAPCPPTYRQLTQRVYPAEELEAARAGDFTVFGKPATLVPPVDWRQDPYASLSWRSALHSMFFMDALLYAHSAHGDVAALAQARDLALDWIGANVPGASGLDAYAWLDKVVGDRAGYLAYLLAASACEGLLSDGQAMEMLDSLTAHGEALETGYYPNTNHGLYMDAGLILVTEYLPFLPESPAWLEFAWSRFKTTFKRHVEWDEGFHKEHSPRYHFIATEILERVLRVVVSEDPEFTALLARMQEAAGWLIMPDGHLPQMGDTTFWPAPQRYRDLGAGDSGLANSRRSGYAIVKEPGRYLIVSAGYHATTHKHADELTFDLFESGQRIVSDTGPYLYEPADRNRQYALSSAAHSVLTVDGQSFPRGRSLIYGTGITAMGQGSGWYAIQGNNPLLPRLGLSHRRVFLYKPGFALVIVDQVWSGTAHDYRRYFHFGPGITVGGRRPRWTSARRASRARSSTRRRTPGRSRAARRIRSAGGASRRSTSGCRARRWSTASAPPMPRA